MIRRVVVGAGIAALVIPGAFVPGSAGAERSPLDRFAAAPSSGVIDPQVTPAAIDDVGRVTVMVEMEGAPVAVREAARGREFSASRDRQVQKSLRAAQNRAATAIDARGGRVDSYVQSAYNGMRVSIARSRLAGLTAIDGVKAVHALPVHELDNETSVPFLGVPGVWENAGVTGEAVKVAVIDTGIDYTHANFGGEGTVEAYKQADATDTDDGDPGNDGQFDGAAQIAGGYDFVGDAYDANAPANTPASVPVPDDDPLDCQGHGSHVAGTVGGRGVLPDGTTYGGTYGSNTHKTDFKIGPGVAPDVDLYALRVFGCAGSTNVTVEAIDWAVENEMDVINMSLGSPFGTADDPSAVASANAVAAGVVVVTSAGNSGPSPYITGSPGTGDGVVSVAATDSTESFPGATLDFDGQTVEAVNANGAEIPAGPFDIVALEDLEGTPQNEALGCVAADYTANGIVPGGNQLAVTVRGTCARVARGVEGQKAGAAAVVMVNSDGTLPPFEGAITENPDTGEEFVVTIPFLGVRGPTSDPQSDGSELIGADGSTVMLAAADIDNPGFRGFASFSSGGPRRLDSAAKPNVSAPGVSTLSTAVGTGSDGSIKSGTSMAAPHVAGVAALGVESHGDWSSEAIAASLVNTADPSGVAGYQLTRGGAGLVDTAQVVGGDVVAYGDSSGSGDSTVRMPSVSFGFAESADTFTGTETITLENLGDEAVTYDVSTAAAPASRPASVTVSSDTVTVLAGKSETVDVTLSSAATNVPGSEVGAGQHRFYEISGNVVFTAGEEVLRAPYLMVPRSLSEVGVTLDGPIDPRSRDKQVVATLDNEGAIAGNADFYSWGIEDAAGDSGAGNGIDLRAVGAQAFDSGGDKLMVFAVNMHDRYSTAAPNEYDVYVDTDRDGTDDFIVLSADSGAVRAGSSNGIAEVFLVDLATGDLFATGFLATAPTDSGTVLLPVFAGDLGVAEDSEAFSYSAVSFGYDGGVDSTTSALYQPWLPAFSSDGAYVPVAPGGSEEVTIDISTGNYRSTKTRGLMVVVYDNAAGAAEAVTVRGR